MRSDKLHKLQEQSSKRHQGLMFKLMIPAPIEEPTTQIPQKDLSMNISEFDKPHVPKVVHVKKIFKSPGVTPDLPKQKQERPKAQYSNIPSPYGIASQLLMDQLKEGR